MVPVSTVVTRLKLIPGAALIALGLLAACSPTPPPPSPTPVYVAPSSPGPVLVPRARG